MTITHSVWLGNLLLARLLNAVMEALKHEYNFQRIIYWTDSKASLDWIKPSKELQTFVENREIRNLTNKENNPADLITKSNSVTQPNSNKIWWYRFNKMCLDSDEINELNINKINVLSLEEVKKQPTTFICQYL